LQKLAKKEGEVALNTMAFGLNLDDIPSTENSANMYEEPLTDDQKREDDEA
jgi:hypothetical protein